VTTDLEGITSQLSIEAQSTQSILNALSTKLASNQTGQIAHHPIMILVDSRNHTTFKMEQLMLWASLTTQLH